MTTAKAHTAAQVSSVKGGTPRHRTHQSRRHTAAQDSSVKGGSQKKARGTFLLEKKQRQTIFPGSNFELFCKGDYSNTDNLGEAKESHFP